MAAGLTERVEAWRDAGRERALPRARHLRPQRRGRRPSARHAARLPVELLRLPALLPSFDGSAVLTLDLPRLRALRQAARVRLQPLLAGRPRRGAGRAPLRGRERVPRRPRHGHLGRDRAAGARHRGPRQAVELAGALLFNGSIVLERASADAGPAAAALAARAAGARLSSERVFRQRVRRPVLGRPPARRRRRPPTSGR